jgi:hypothetical protein
MDLGNTSDNPNHHGNVVGLIGLHQINNRLAQLTEIVERDTEAQHPSYSGPERAKLSDEELKRLLVIVPCPLKEICSELREDCSAINGDYAACPVYQQYMEKRDL